MKLQGQTIIYTILVFISLTVTVTYAVDCGKFSIYTQCISKPKCEFYTAKTCTGDSVSICADSTQCQITTTCAQEARTKRFYSFPTNCLPVGFNATVSSKCTCSNKPPPAPPGTSYCAQFVTADTCKAQKANCESILGKSCGNDQITICRAKALCSSQQKCALEPATGIYWLFEKGCLPNNWIFEHIQNCTCKHSSSPKW